MPAPVSESPSAWGGGPAPASACQELLRVFAGTSCAYAPVYEWGIAVYRQGSS